MRCPLDRTELKAPESKGKTQGCGHCQGVLFSDDHLVRIIRNNGFDILKIKSDHPRRIGCPGCELSMRIYDLQGIEIDVCPKCHVVWMDEGEFAKVRGTLEMEKSRRAASGTRDKSILNSNDLNVLDAADLFGVMLDLLSAGFTDW
jgi:Zn-finger nucleic acid-binding protein